MMKSFFASLLVAGSVLSAGEDAALQSVALNDPANTEVKTGKAATREALAKRQAALGHAETTVTVEVTVNGQPQPAQEQRAKLPATFISAQGMAIGTLPNPKANGAPPGMDIKFNTTLKDINLLTSDGVEIPARLVLKDEETGIAFFAPLKPLDKAVSFVDLSRPGAEPAVLDELYLQLRTDEKMFNTVITQAFRITGAVTAPRKLWLMQGGAPSGVIVSDAQGQPVGVIAEQSNVPVVLPLSKLAKLIVQAEAEAAKPAEVAKTPENKDVEPKAEGAPKP
ncbi:MAG: hypothetical protein RL095_1501 [Verrucomicrobiota bacterium]|jgi:hypothetical protein